MTREIKFRVWDKRCKLYLDIVATELGCHDTKFCGFKYLYLKPQNDSVPMINPTLRYGGCLGFKLTDSMDYERLIFEQYTGLQDENGKDIYEGDFVEYSELLYSVKYRRSRFMLHAPRKHSVCLSKLTYDCKTNRLNCKVVGNIHEYS